MKSNTPAPTLGANFFRNVWIAYALALVFAQAFSLAPVAKAFSLTWLHWLGAGIQAWFITGVLGYAMNRPIGSSVTWSAAFWVACFCHIIAAINLTRVVGLQGSGFVVYWVIATLPMLYALWVYQRSDHPRWKSLEAYRNHRLMQSIDFSAGSLSRSIHHEDEHGKTIVETVTLARHHDVFVVKLNINRDGQTKNYQNEFWSLESAVGFIERQSRVRLTDFATNAASSTQAPGSDKALQQVNT